MKVIRPLVGILLLVGGVGLAVFGGMAIATFGTSGTLQVVSTPLKSEGDSYALVADVLGVSAGFPGSSSLGTTTLGAQSGSGERLFVGVGSRSMVDEYLFGVPFDAIRQDGSEWALQPVPGTDEPDPAQEQKLWVAKATGNEPTVTFKPPSSGSGSTFVIMNADGAPSVGARMTIGYASQWVFPLAVAALVVGILMALEGAYLLLRRKRRESAGDVTGPPAPTMDESGDPVTDAGAGQVGAGTESVPEPAGQDAPAPAASDDERAEPESAGGPPAEWFREEDSPRA